MSTLTRRYEIVDGARETWTLNAPRTGRGLSAVDYDRETGQLVYVTQETSGEQNHKQDLTQGADPFGYQQGARDVSNTQKLEFVTPTGARIRGLINTNNQYDRKEDVDMVRIPGQNSSVTGGDVRETREMQVMDPRHGVYASTNTSVTYWPAAGATAIHNTGQIPGGLPDGAYYKERGRSVSARFTRFTPTGPLAYRDTAPIEYAFGPDSYNTTALYARQDEPEGVTVNEYRPSRPLVSGRATSGGFMSITEYPNDAGRQVHVGGTTHEFPSWMQGVTLYGVGVI